ncbi:tetraacyldisaccharide 4'-kinase [Flavobacterium sp.]|uniref:tetraacyldisaccharide 4'-kinase n=1 Tax=Flavobacterium sp. TaxID=239 RepID=UPI0035AF37CE
MRKLLFPFSIIYGCIMSIRNFLYDRGILKSYSFDIPIIVVGNLSVGGTGKTPQTEYLIKLLIKEFKVAVLSRGYGRKTKGFIEANKNATAETIGDEPFQIYQKFPEIDLAVDADRKNGIEKLISNNKPDVIILDDAFQHRRVKAGFYILLTAFDDLYCNDLILPAGNLRESRKGAERADVIIITKCPNNLSDIAQENIRKRIGVKKPIYFSKIVYSNEVVGADGKIPIQEIIKTEKVLLAGIAKPKPFFEYLQSDNDVVLKFKDHHNFTDEEIERLKTLANNKIIVTTEKDYVRLKDKQINKLYCLPMESKFVLKGDDFDNKILKYVRKSTRNS